MSGLRKPWLYPQSEVRCACGAGRPTLVDVTREQNTVYNSPLAAKLLRWEVAA